MIALQVHGRLLQRPRPHRSRDPCHLDVVATRLVQEDRTLTHQIGELAHQLLYQGVLNGSAAGVDNVLSVFSDDLRGGRLLPELEATWTDLDDLPIF
jgi:hypothetical protein